MTIVTTPLVHFDPLGECKKQFYSKVAARIKHFDTIKGMKVVAIMYEPKT